jgi:hypothetical protein
VTLNHLMSDDPRLRPAVAVTRRATSPGSTSFCQRSQLGIAIIVVRNSRQRIRPPKDGSPGRRMVPTTKSRFIVGRGVGVVSPGFRIAADRDWLRLFIYFLSTLRAAGRTRC